jgi:hypothetical protein
LSGGEYSPRISGAEQPIELREKHYPPPKYMLNDNIQSQLYTAISINVVHEQSGKVEYERERLLGIALKIH